MKSKKFILFWIKSNRGTDSKGCYIFPSDASKEHIKAELDYWCSGYGCWEKSESIVSYGFKTVKIPPKKELRRMFDKACKAKQKAKEKWDTLVALLNPLDRTGKSFR